MIDLLGFTMEESKKPKHEVKLALRYCGTDAIMAARYRTHTEFKWHCRTHKLSAATNAACIVNKQPWCMNCGVSN